MIKTLLGTKLGMTHAYTDTGKWVAVTKMAVGPCRITQIKDEKKDGYEAVQISFGKKRRLNKPMAGHLNKSKVKSQKSKVKSEKLKVIGQKSKIEDQKQEIYMPSFIREIRGEAGELKIGDQIAVSDIFGEGDVVKVAGTNKGRGFAGVMKRWGFAGGHRTHGQSDRQRAPGSIGQGTDPGRVHRGKKMPGHYGAAAKTVLNLRVVKVDDEQDELWVSGAVPGYRGGMVRVTVTEKRKKKSDEVKKEEKNE